MRLLILNVFSRNSLAAVNALDPGYELIGGAYSQSSLRLLLKLFRNKRLKDIFWYSNPLLNSDAFRNDIIKAVERFKPDGIISSGTTDTDYLSYYKNEIVNKTGVHVLVDDFNKLGKLTDKLQIFSICREIGVPMPKTARLKRISHLPEAIRGSDLKYPVVIKPRNAYASIGVKFFDSDEDVKMFIDSKEADDFHNMGEFVAQEKLSGRLHDVTSCAFQGNVVSMLSQERLLSLYDFGGGGIINRTTNEPEIMGYAEKIIKHMQFSGIVLFDFLKSKDKFYLLECNPKIWGTTQLTIEAGLNVVQQLVDTHILGADSISRPDYEIGLVYKWLFPECIVHWFQRPRHFSSIAKRIGNTFRRYKCTRTLNNLQFNNLIHLTGVILANYKTTSMRN